MFPSPSKQTSVRLIGRTSPFYLRNGTRTVPGDEGDDAIQRVAQVSNLDGGWQLPLLEWVD